jgi:uncharacterized membrane protein YdjX (TVP38/TMEM64 family)
VADAVAAERSLGAAVETLRGGARTLAPLSTELPPWLDDVVPDAAVLDPERPVDLDGFVREVLLGDGVEPRRHPLLQLVTGLLVLVAIATLWRWTPLGGRLDSVSVVLVPYATQPTSVPVILGVFVTASLLGVPVSALIVLTALLLGPKLGFLHALGGVLASATIAYAAGRWLPREAVRRIAGRRLNTLSRRLMRRGALAVARLRLSPTAPFATVGLVAGAMRVRARDFFGGTMLVLVPGTLLLAVFGARLAEVLAARDGGGFQALLGVAAVVLLLLATTWLKRRVPVRTATGG